MNVNFGQLKLKSNLKWVIIYFHSFEKRYRYACFHAYMSIYVKLVTLIFISYISSEISVYKNNMLENIKNDLL